MKIATKLKLALLLAVFLAVPIALYFGNTQVSAHEGENHDVAQAEDQSAPKLGTYSYVAQPGDSYTLMARKAVQTYGKKFDVKLSLADIIFAETNLTQAAGSPQLAIGQQVEVDEATVKNWVDKAGALSEETEAAWGHYVQSVDSFNTDSVGQAH